MSFFVDARVVAAVASAMDSHEQAMKLEANMEPETRVWHMIASLLEYCDEHQLNFDLILESVREDEAELRAH